MPFGEYAAKSVQMMGDLFNAPRATSIYRKAGYIGSKIPGAGSTHPFEAMASAVAHDARAIRRGKTRVGLGAGGLFALGANGRSSGGGRGIQPRSSAPPPMDPYSQF